MIEFHVPSLSRRNQGYAVVSPQLAKEIAEHVPSDEGIIGSLIRMPVFTSSFVKRGGYLVGYDMKPSKEVPEEMRRVMNDTIEKLLRNGDAGECEEQQDQLGKEKKD